MDIAPQNPRVFYFVQTNASDCIQCVEERRLIGMGYKPWPICKYAAIESLDKVTRTDLTILNGDIGRRSAAFDLNHPILFSDYIIKCFIEGQTI